MLSQVSNYLAQYQKILHDNYIVPDPCAFYSNHSLDYIIDPKNQNYTTCTCHSCQCEKHFYNKQEW